MTALAESATDSIRYWEPRRLLYNAALAIVVVFQFLVALPTAREALSVDLGLSFFALAVVANVLYCAAYVPDLFAQVSALRAPWLRARWVLLVVGTAFGATLAHFIAMSLFACRTR